MNLRQLLAEGARTTADLVDPSDSEGPEDQTVNRALTRTLRRIADKLDPPKTPRKHDEQDKQK